MPSKNKKGVHNVSKVHRQVPRNRKQARKADEKKLKGSQKRLKKEQKKNRNAVSSPATEDTDNLESSQHETSGARKMPKEDINLPHSSCSKPSTSRASGHQEYKKNVNSKMKKNINPSHSSGEKPIKPSTYKALWSSKKQPVNQKSDSGKGKKNNNRMDTSCNKPSTSSTVEQQVNQKIYSKKGKKNTTLPNKSCNIPSTSCTIVQKDKKEENSKENKKTGNVHGPVEEKSFSETKSLNLKTPENVIESKKSDGNIIVTEADKPQKNSNNKKPLKSDLAKTLKEDKKEKVAEKESIKSKDLTSSTSSDIAATKVGKLLNNSDDKNPHKTNEAKILQDENKEVGEEPTKIKSLASITSSIVATIENKKATEDLTDKRKILEEKLKASETESKSLDEKWKLLASVTEMEMAVFGDIKLRPKEQSVKINDNKWAKIASYDPSKRMVFLGDKNVKISIKVNQGSQVVCNVRNRQEIDLFQNVATGSDTVEGHAVGNPDENANAENLEEHDKTSNDTQRELNVFRQFSNAYCQTDNYRAVGNSCTDTVIDSDAYHKNATETGVSQQEKLEKICNDYLENVKLVLETFEGRFKNYIKDKSL